ncbi:hypothetical protein OIO90_004933 [Microbotryomycetes sp. JL221]|nr:hypothetical protein OIO90_004933 [Microbotryomycetes sp. JL221]
MFARTAIALPLLATAAKAAFIMSSPPQLVECANAQFNWTGGLPPYRLTMANGNDTKVYRSSKAGSMLIDYPRGTLLNIRIDSGSAGSPNFALSGSMVVQPGTDQSCIPPENEDNQLIFTDPIEWVNLPEQLTGCTGTTFSWTGGTAPYTLRIYPLNSGGLFEEYTVSTTTYNWQVDMPFGSTVYAWVVGTNYMTSGSSPSFSPTYYIFNGTDDSCVPTANVNASVSDPPPKPVVVINTRTSSIVDEPSDTALFTGNRDSVNSTLGAGAIAGIVVGCVSIVFIYLLYVLLKRRSRNQQSLSQQQLASTTEFDDEDGKSGIKAVTTAANVHPAQTFQMNTLEKNTGVMTTPGAGFESMLGRQNDDASSSKSVLSPPPPIGGGARYGGNNGKGRA